MKLSKLKRLHVVIIGAVVCAIVGAGLFFLVIKKSNEKLAAAQAQWDQYQPTGNIENVRSMERDRDKARAEVATAQNDLDRYMISKMPNLVFSDPPGSQPGTGRAMGMFALYHEETQVLPPLLVRWALTKSKVSLDSGFTIGAPPFNPNDPIFESDVIKIPVGKVKVTGTYTDILAHIRKWNDCGRLVQVGAPSFTGNSPKLSCDYDMTVYIMPKSKADKTKPLGIAGAPGASKG